jgi:hypothetical protein
MKTAFSVHILRCESHDTRKYVLSKRFGTLIGVSNVLAATWILPGAVWTDTAGNTIDAHGGGIVERPGLGYFIGLARAPVTVRYGLHSQPENRKA